MGIHKLDDRQLDTILAALRHWQKSLPKGVEADLLEIASRGDEHAPLSVDEIDQLCEKINCGEDRIYELLEGVAACDVRFMKEAPGYLGNNTDLAWRAGRMDLANRLFALLDSGDGVSAAAAVSSRSGEVRGDPTFSTC